MDLVTLLTIITTFLVLFFAYVKHKHNFWASRDVKGPKPVFLLGNLLDYYHRPYFNLFIENRRKYGKVYGFYDGLHPKLIVHDADLIKDVMVRDFSNFADRRTTGFDHSLEQKFMFVMEGEKWKKMRSIMTPAFSTSKLKAMSSHFINCADRAVLELTKTLGQVVEMKAVARGYSVDVIGRTAFGVEFDAYDKTKTIPVLESALKYFRSPSTLKTIVTYFLPAWFKLVIKFSVFNIQCLYDFNRISRAMIDERRRSSNLEQSYPDFLTLMINSADKITDEEVAANMFLFFALGFETASYHLAFTCFRLAKHPEIQERLQEEIDKNFEGDSSKVTIDSTQNLDYLNAVLTEILRLYPPSTFTERVATKDCHLAGIHLPRGTGVFFPIYDIQHNEEYFEDPEEFKPDRFLPENKDSFNQFAFLPFGHGPRNCIGMRYADIQVKMVLCKILLKFNIKKCDETPDYLDLSETNDEFLMSQDIPLKFESRK